MTNMMKALVKTKPEVGLWMERVPVPEVGPNDVLIRVRKSAICGEQFSVISSLTSSPNWRCGNSPRNAVRRSLTSSSSTNSSELRVTRNW